MVMESVRHSQDDEDQLPIYSQGNLVFTADGSCLLSPVGNKVTIFDLVNNQSHTLPYSHRKNIACIGLSPRGDLLLSIDEDGQAILGHVARRIPLYHFSFRGPVATLAFSPEGTHFAVGRGRFVEVWQTPQTPGSSQDGELEFAPFVRHHVHAGHHDQVLRIEWSSDSRFFLSASKDLVTKVWSLYPEEGFVPTSLTGHREDVLGAWFSDDQEIIYTVSKDGALFRWEYATPLEGTAVIPGTRMAQDELKWRIVGRHYFMQNNAKAKCATFHPQTGLLVVGFSNGIFGLYELPDFNLIHTLSISQNAIDQVSINKSGEWLAFGASRLGQLLVWEWQSESYILKQQAHLDATNSAVYSQDGQQIITTADDGKVKVWDVQSGFCNVTFTEHTGAVTDCEFAKKGRVLFTASLDGSVRAWDLIRYRNFRTFTASKRTPFSCLAIDPSGEVVCAGSLDTFEVFIWSVQTGQLLDQLAGHEGPVSTLAFAPTGGTLVSGSWDHTVRIWSIFGRTQTSEPLDLRSDVLCIAISPDSRQLAVSTLDGQLAFWSIADAAQEGGVEGRRDVSGGRKVSDRMTAANAAGTKSFSSLKYSIDGTCVLAGGNSKFLCLYEVQTGTLLKKWTVSVNLALDGTQEILNSKRLTESGPIDMIDEDGEASDLNDRLDRSLPGATRGDASVRKTRPAVRVSAVAFAPTGRTFCAATTEGLLLYSLDASLTFDPFDLDVSVTPSTTLEALAAQDYLRALVMAFRLNELPLVRRVYLAIPPNDISLVVVAVPPVYLARLLRFVAHEAETSPHLERHLRWLVALLNAHGQRLKDEAGTYAGELRAAARAVARIRTELARVAEGNGFLVDYWLGQPREEDGEDALKAKLLLPNGQRAHEIAMEEDLSDSEGEWMGVEDD